MEVYVDGRRVDDRRVERFLGDVGQHAREYGLARGVQHIRTRGGEDVYHFRGPTLAHFLNPVNPSTSSPSLLTSVVRTTSERRNCITNEDLLARLGAYCVYSNQEATERAQEENRGFFFGFIASNDCSPVYGNWRADAFESNFRSLADYFARHVNPHLPPNERLINTFSDSLFGTSPTTPPQPTSAISRPRITRSGAD